jgi:hypothetical protein
LATFIEIKKIKIPNSVFISNIHTEFGIIIETCRNLLLYFEHCKVSYVRRQANRVTHDLAQAARFNASHQVFDYCPPCIEATIMNEMH